MNISPQKRVLIIDDDEGLTEPLQMALEAAGYQVLTAHDGNEGVMKIERDAPDLVLLDLVMPRRSGFAVLDSIINQKHRAPRIIMVTGNTEAKYRELALERGVDRFIPKPYQIDDLVEAVNELLKSESTE
ncbi:Alkaline phosphatase synthesis transcriptional regulatory protein PhoP [Gimesia alba]|uniref:Alkaline phosphatase synthesis transcriptional regulatory protein PhoP n=1 Tax=Gimesia alba TaxID=2527973 RepID=A0A517RBW9_9PLAN|nr:response regulator transcription factor [Gimesia alba]QDT41380.1 Alkaline phosphatase synthesis transcriptional regulatory protein PhoP [Gimesia alba]